MTEYYICGSIKLQREMGKEIGMVTESNREISFVIERYLGVLSESQNGWKKELNLVSWNGKPAKLDLREWSPDHQRMAKGVTLRYEEARLLQRALYRWLTGYGKPAAEPETEPEAGMEVEPETEPAAGLETEPAAEPEAGLEVAAVMEAIPVPEVDPETGEILELPAEAFEEAPRELETTDDSEEF